MKYLSAYVLLTIGGKTDVSESDLSEYLKSVGCEVDEEQVKTVCKQLKGKALHELCNNGMTKICSMNLGGGGGAGGDKKAEERGRGRRGRVRGRRGRRRLRWNV